MAKGVIPTLVDAKAYMDFARTAYYSGAASLDEFAEAEEALIRAELAWAMWLGRADLARMAADRLDECMHADEIVEGVLDAVGDFMADREAQAARAQFRVVS